MTQPQEPSLGEKIKARRAAVQNDLVRVYVEEQLAAAKAELIEQVATVQETVVAVQDQVAAVQSDIVATKSDVLAVQDQVAAVQEGVQVLNTPAKGQLA